MTKINPDTAVLRLTKEIPNYADRLARELRGPESELWALSLAVSGRMTYPPSSGAVKLGVPDATLEPGLTRFEYWRAALASVLQILGDPESRYRTGYDSAELGPALQEFFGSER